MGNRYSSPWEGPIDMAQVGADETQGRRVSRKPWTIFLPWKTLMGTSGTSNSFDR
jgi:hypothetical protein